MIRPVFKSNKTPLISVDENMIANTSIYPNPARDMVVLEGLDASKEYYIQIYDMSGKLVLTERTFGRSQYELRIENLETGYYILNISDQLGASANHKLMITE